MQFATPLQARAPALHYSYPRAITIRDICAAFHTVAGYSMPRTVPASLIRAGLAGLEAVHRRSSGSLSPDRIRKLTASTNIWPATLLELGFEWETDILS